MSKVLIHPASYENASLAVEKAVALFPDGTGGTIWGKMSEVNFF